MDTSELDVEKIHQKIEKIKKNRKKKQQPLLYNYKNIDIIPTIYDVVSYEKVVDISNTTNTPIPYPPDLQQLSKPETNYIPFNNTNFINSANSSANPSANLNENPSANPSANLNENPSANLNENLSANSSANSSANLNENPSANSSANIFSSMYHYWLPIKEGATSNTNPSSDFDITKLNFWNLGCNNLFSMDTYTNVFSVFVGNYGTYTNTDIDQKNRKKDAALIKSFFDQMLMIILAYVMTINIYYFTFMYKWDCRHWAYVPKHGVYFGKSLNEILDFFLKDTRVPVFFCQYIYTYIYPTIFEILQVKRYKRICFLFTFIFMLCFVFITGKQIGLSVSSFVMNGKINPMVIMIVLMSVFYGVFFADENEIDKNLEDGLTNVCTDNKAISTKLIHFCNEENLEKVNGRPYYYSLKEKYDDFNKIIDNYNKKTDNPPTEPNYISLLRAFVNKYTQSNTTTLVEASVNEKQPSAPASSATSASSASSATLPSATLPSATSATLPSATSVSSGIPSSPLETEALKFIQNVHLPIPPKKIKLLAILSVAKGYTIMMAIIRLIIAMMSLPVAQIFVSWFFLYTTTGIGLLFEEGISNIYQTILCIKGHMNDNDGEDAREKNENEFYKSVNNSPFFKFWINELLLTTIYSIYCIVKFVTVPTQITNSQINVKIIMAIVISIISIIIIARGYLLHRRHCNMNREMCTFKDLKTIEKKEMSENGEEKRYEKLGVRSYENSNYFENRIKEVFEMNELKYFISNNAFFNKSAIIITDETNKFVKLIIDLNNIYDNTKPINPPTAIATLVKEVSVPEEPMKQQYGGNNTIDSQIQINNFKKLFLDNMDFELLENDNIYTFIKDENENENMIYVGKIKKQKIELDTQSGLDDKYINTLTKLLEFYLYYIKPILSEYKNKNKNKKVGFFKNRTTPFNNLFRQGKNLIKDIKYKLYENKEINTDNNPPIVTQSISNINDLKTYQKGGYYYFDKGLYNAIKENNDNDFNKIRDTIKKYINKPNANANETFISIIMRNIQKININIREIEDEINNSDLVKNIQYAVHLKNRPIVFEGIICLRVIDIIKRYNVVVVQFLDDAVKYNKYYLIPYSSKIFYFIPREIQNSIIFLDNKNKFDISDIMRDELLKNEDNIYSLLNDKENDIVNFGFKFQYKQFYYSKLQNILLQFLFKDKQELVFVSTHNKIVHIDKNDLIKYNLIEIKDKCPKIVSTKKIEGKLVVDTCQEKKHDEIMVKFNEFKKNNKEKGIDKNFKIKIKGIIKELIEYPEQIDSNNYEKLKRSFIQRNTYFFRRQKDNEWVQGSPIWFDYTGRISDKSSHNNPNKKSILINNFYYSHNNLFKPEMDGEVIAVYKVITPLKIIHFPFTTNFNSPDLNITAAHASLLPGIIEHDKDVLGENMGYTADFLTFKNYNSLPDYGTFYPGYRQLFIPAQYNNAAYLEKIEDMTEIKQIYRKNNINYNANANDNANDNANNTNDNANTNNASTNAQNTGVSTEHTMHTSTN